MANKLLNINTNKLSKTQLEELVQVLSLKIEDQNRTIEFLRSTFSELESSINTLKTNFQSLQEKYDKQEILLKRKNTSIRNLQNLLYGSKSEKQDKEQDKKPTTDGVRELTLFETDEVTQERLDFLEAQQKKEDEQKASVCNPKSKKKRIPRTFLEGLPEKIVRLKPPIDNYDLYRYIGQEVTKKLACIPKQIFVKVFIREKYMLKTEYEEQNEKAESDQQLPFVAIAELPLFPLHKSIADASILAEILMQKYAYHMPFYRQIEQFKQLKVNIPPSTINDWYNGASQLLEPLYNLIKKEILSTNYIQMDETILPVLEKRKGKKSIKQYLWAIRSPEKKLVFFDYDKGSRSAASALKILGNYEGYLQCDGYAAYEVVRKERNGKIELLNCWVHAKRKFLQAEDSDVATYVVKQISKLYHIEHEIQKQSLSPDEIVKERARLAAPVIDHLKWYITEKYVSIYPNSKLAGAMKYIYALLPNLRTYLKDSKLLLDNNGVEYTIRNIAIGRKNFMFCGSHKSAKQTAIMFTLINSCKQHKINIREWLIDVLNRLPQLLKDKDDLHILLPQNYEKIIRE